jgi:GDP-mannose 6-dehydrogenase
MSMRVSVIGLGYVGTTTAACLAARGHTVVGVDVNPLKAGMVGRGQSPVIEEGLGERLAAALAAGRLTATTSVDRVAQDTDLSLVCVGTPSRRNGSLDLDHLVRAVESVGRSLAVAGRYHVVAVRSTVLPGTIDRAIIPALEAASGKRVGADFGVCANPEFLREGEAVRDFESPPFTLIGEADSRAGDVVATLYEGMSAPLIRTEVRVAEAVKYVSNAFHALKISFANEIGVLLAGLGVDPFPVLDIFKRDTRLNISGAYLRPGFAFGGSCLPKDLRAALHAARSNDLDLPVLGAILPGNEVHLQRGIDLVVGTGGKRIGVLGLSFKPGTDDLRESPLVRMVEALLGKGLDLRIYDGRVSLARLVGANKEYIETVIPHLATLLASDLDEVLDHAEVVVVGRADPEFAALPGRLRPGQVLVDLVRMWDDGGGLGKRYKGLSW